MFRTFIAKNLNFLILGISILFFGVFTENFLTTGNLENVLTNTVYIGVLAIGAFCVILVKGIDVSLGAIVYLSGIVLAELTLSGYSLWVAIPIVIFSGTLLGAANGFFVTIVGVTPFLATLFNMIVFRGIGKWITKSKAYDYPENLIDLASIKFSGVPLWVVVVLLLSLVVWCFFRYVPAGRFYYAAGHNKEVALKAGIKVKSVVFSSYCAAGTFAGIASIILASQIGRHSAGMGELDELDAIAAAVLGGAGLFGGTGNVFGVVFGALTVQTINAGLVFSKVDLYVQPMVTAMILFLAVAANSFGKK